MDRLRGYKLLLVYVYIRLFNWIRHTPPNESINIVYPTIPRQVHNPLEETRPRALNSYPLRVRKVSQTLHEGSTTVSIVKHRNNQATDLVSSHDVATTTTLMVKKALTTSRGRG
jgi:hypothetical protein